VKTDLFIHTMVSIFAKKSASIVKFDILTQFLNTKYFLWSALRVRFSFQRFHFWASTKDFYYIDFRYDIPSLFTATYWLQNEGVWIVLRFEKVACSFLWYVMSFIAPITPIEPPFFCYVNDKLCLYYRSYCQPEDVDIHTARSH
jgi:hypothetical protein